MYDFVVYLKFLEDTEKNIYSGLDIKIGATKEPKTIEEYIQITDSINLQKLLQHIPHFSELVDRAQVVTPEEYHHEFRA